MMAVYRPRTATPPNEPTPAQQREIRTALEGVVRALGERQTLIEQFVERLQIKARCRKRDDGLGYDVLDRDSRQTVSIAATLADAMAQARDFDRRVVRSEAKHREMVAKREARLLDEAAERTRRAAEIRRAAERKVAAEQGAKQKDEAEMRAVAAQVVAMSVASATKAVQKTIEQLHGAGEAAPARRKGIIERVTRKTVHRDAQGRIESVTEESGELPGA